MQVQWITLTTTFYISALICIAMNAKQAYAGRRHNRRGNNNGGNQKPEKSIPTFQPTPKNITVGPGDRAVLKCRVENLGTKTVSWHKAEKRHPLTIGLFTFAPDNRISVDYNQRTNEWSLIIQDIKPEDEGVYKCLISSKELSRRTYDIKLNVKTVQVSGTEFVEKGNTVHLVCNATGKPDPPHDVEWFKNGDKIDSDANSGILITKKIETRVLISVLVIKKSKAGDTGDYICRSSNRDAGLIKVHILNVAAANKKRGTQVQKITGGVGNGVSRPTLHSSPLGLVTLVVLASLCTRLSPSEHCV